MWLRRFTNFLVLGTVKILARTFYRVENEWVHKTEGDPWKGMRILALLNHTSLYEPLFLGAAPWRVVWRIAGRIIAPGADVTMDRPIAGFILSLVAPKMVPISRERDETWDNFLKSIEPESVVIILPEGRMMRADGLDKNGNPMSARGGIADILEMLGDGIMVIVYSGGLHHVQVPGQTLPKLFKRIRVRCERVDIRTYIEEMHSVPETTFKKAVMRDLDQRLEKYKPVDD